MVVVLASSEGRWPDRASSFFQLSFHRLTLSIEAPDDKVWLTDEVARDIRLNCTGLRDHSNDPRPLVRSAYDVAGSG